MFDLAKKYWDWKTENKAYMKYRLAALLGLGGTLRNQGKDHVAGKAFIKSYESGVKSKNGDDYWLTIEFNDGSSFVLWVASKMYAYGSGNYKLPCGTRKQIQGLLPKWVNLIVLSVEKS